METGKCVCPRFIVRRHTVLPRGLFTSMAARFLCTFFKQIDGQQRNNERLGRHRRVFYTPWRWSKNTHELYLFFMNESILTNESNFERKRTKYEPSKIMGMKIGTTGKMYGRNVWRKIVLWLFYTRSCARYLTVRWSFPRHFLGDNENLFRKRGVALRSCHRRLLSFKALTWLALDWPRRKHY